MGKIATLKKDVESYQNQERTCQGLLNDEILAREASILERIQKDLKDTQDREKLPALSLDTIDDIRDRLSKLYTNRVNSYQGQSRQQVTDIVNGMREFSPDEARTGAGDGCLALRRLTNIGGTMNASSTMICRRIAINLKSAQ